MASHRDENRPGATARLKSLFYHAQRRLLHAWIRPTVLDCAPETLGISPQQTICYVLPVRSLTDLAIVDQACEEAGLPRPVAPLTGTDESRSFFFLTRAEGRFGRRTGRHHSARLLRLMAEARASGRSVRIVPVSLFWGHQPKREQSLLHALLSENWSATNRFKKLLTILLHRRHILVQFSTPFDLLAVLQGEDDHERQERKLFRLLRSHFNRQKQAILGPDLSHRRTLINNLLTTTPVVNAIEAEARQSDISVAAARDRAHAYANEIASHQSYRIMHGFDIVLRWLWQRLYDGIRVNNVASVKLLAEANEVIYVPCHRSHIDYLLLSYVLYHNGLTPPHIAAGRNLNLPVVGPILRRSGAFFMRRSFQGDALYRAVFDEYIHLIFVKGHSVEYFIEGGRSRTGRMLTPKGGMLGMTIRSLQRNASLPIVLVPVYIGYERILEASTYLGELRGSSKKTESIFDILKVLKSLRDPLGEVTVTFGEAVHLGAFLDRELPDWQSPDALSAALSRTASALGREVAATINAAVFVNPVNLVSTALLATPRQTIEDAHLEHQVGVLQTIARDAPLGSHAAVTELTPREVIEHAGKVAGLQPTSHTFGRLWKAEPGMSLLLTYYRNNTAHAFVVPSLMARYVSTHTTTSEEHLHAFCTRLYPYLRTEFYLEVKDFAAYRERCIDVLIRVGAISLEEDRVIAAEPASRDYVTLTDLARIAEPTLERFYIVTSLLRSNRPRSVRELEAAAARVAQRLSALFGINSPSFFDRSLFSNFVGALKSEDELQVQAGNMSTAATFSELDAVIASTLDPTVRFNILQGIERVTEPETEMTPPGSTPDQLRYTSKVK